MKKSILHGIAATFAAAVLYVSGALAQVPENPAFANIDIINFGQMDGRFYRGGQPEMDDYAALAALGVKTVIDLRNDPTDYEKPQVEALGMRYVNIPMSGWKYPNDKDVEAFMALINDPETGIVYVHCKAGKHRTGLAGAVYRFNQYGWTYDQAYKEMKKFNYTSWPVHFNIKSYVKDYAKRHQVQIAERATLVANAAAVGTSN